MLVVQECGVWAKACPYVWPMRCHKLFSMCEGPRGGGCANPGVQRVRFQVDRPVVAQTLEVDVGINELLSIWKRFSDPSFRWCDVPGADAFAQMRLLHPGDTHLRELHDFIEREQIGRSLAGGDPFFANDPPRGVLPPLTNGRIPICTLRTGDVLSIGVDDLSRNTLVVGPTGGGKSSWLAILVASMLREM